ncbi:MAG: DUF4105 domain-containing protein [Bdellovibrionaceae bacterium]|nr:DUF4105 domain-containing protein [Pseudobdellovibrionaceae bacterium]
MSGPRSSVRTPEFFLSSDGAVDPAAEWRASLRAFRRGERRVFAGEEQPLRCWFPARAELMERLSGEKFPAASCPAIERWRQALGGDRISVIFAGAYANNPASLFGHTLLRFGRGGEDRSDKLRTYSAGFLAATDPDDSKPVTIFKGLFGGYLGSFNVKPQYMTAALYNNSESRDLWEYPLSLTTDEVRWAKLYLWELSHGGGMVYYFADWNCSYRLLTFLDAVRPGLDLAARTDVFVLPLDTLRLMDEAALIERPGVGFEPSLRRRLDLKIAAMTPDERRGFREGRRDGETLRSLSSPLVLDALIDHWTARNYEQQTLLSPEERGLFDLTFQRRAALRVVTAESHPPRPVPDPDRGHPTSWAEASAGGVIRTFSSRLGAHDLRSPTGGYDGSAAIEYLGVDLHQDVRRGVLSSGRFLIGDVAALNDWSREFPAASWRAHGSVRFERGLRDEWRWWVDGGGGYGLSAEVSEGLLLFLLPSARVALNLGRAESWIAPALWGGARWEKGKNTFSLLTEIAREHDRDHADISLRWSRWLGRGSGLFAEAKGGAGPWKAWESDFAAGVRVYF